MTDRQSKTPAQWAAKAAEALENARRERDRAARLRDGLRTSLDREFDLDRIEEAERNARRHEDDFRTWRLLAK